MTMFRRVFSTHFEEQDKEVAPPKPAVSVHDIPPAPPLLPPQLKLHGKSPYTELAQKPHLEDNQDFEDEADEEDGELAARAAEIHEKMLQSSAPKPVLHQSVAPKPPSPEPTRAEATPQPRPSGRARTRLLGFDTGTEAVSDPFSQAEASVPTPARTKPAGWVAITKGAGLGRFFAVFSGVSMIGRGEDQAIRLDFGDQTISRKNHAAIAYDAEDNKFYLGHGGKSNIIKRNGCPVLSTEEIFHGDSIRIGETTLRFVALCGKDFQWGAADDA